MNDKTGDQKPATVLLAFEQSLLDNICSEVIFSETPLPLSAESKMKIGHFKSYLDELGETYGERQTGMSSSALKDNKL